MKVLVLCDDRWHPGTVVRKGTEPISKRNIQFSYLESIEKEAFEHLGEFPVLLLSKSNHRSSTDHEEWLDECLAEKLANYVGLGGGLVAVHSGTAGYERSATMRGLLGGAFLDHPDQCPVTISITAGHPVTEGVDSFTVMDEHYRMQQFGTDIKIFATTSSPGIKQPGCWVANRGFGRICVITPGHELAVWLNPHFQRLLYNALRWCAKNT